LHKCQETPLRASQGLKPQVLCASCGTTEVVPFQRTIYATSSRSCVEKRVSYKKAASAKTASPFLLSTGSSQLRVLRFGLLEDGDVGAAVFPECKNIVVGGFRFGVFACHRAHRRAALPTTANSAPLKSSRSSRRCYRLCSSRSPNASRRETVFL
jgi:hypothetical protein